MRTVFDFYLVLNTAEPKSVRATCGLNAIEVAKEEGYREVLIRVIRYRVDGHTLYVEAVKTTSSPKLVYHTLDNDAVKHLSQSVNAYQLGLSAKKLLNVEQGFIAWKDLERTDTDSCTLVLACPTEDTDLTDGFHWVKMDLRTPNLTDCLCEYIPAGVLPVTVDLCSVLPLDRYYVLLVAQHLVRKMRLK